MDPSEATYVFQEPTLMFLVLPILGLWLWALLAVCRIGNLGGPPAGVRTVIVGVLLAAASIAPVRVIQVALMVLLASTVSLGAFAVLQATPWGRRELVMPSIRRRLAKSREADVELLPGKTSREVQASTTYSSSSVSRS